jgi:hypothetical protein
MFHAQEEDAKIFYKCHTHDMSLWGAFFLALWSDFVFCPKFCESMQEPFHYRFLQSLKWKPLPRPCKSLNVELQSFINLSLILPLPHEIITRQILTCLHLHKNPSMLWQLCHVNKEWHAFIDQSLKWQGFQVVKS